MGGVSRTDSVLDVTLDWGCPARPDGRSEPVARAVGDGSRESGIDYPTPDSRPRSH